MPSNKPFPPPSTPRPTTPPGSAAARLSSLVSPLGSPPRQPAFAAAPMQGVPLALVGLVLGLGAMVLAAGCAWLLMLWLDVEAPWAAALAAGAAVAVASVPLGVVLWKLARALPTAADDSGAAGVAPAGLSRALFIDLAQREFARGRRYGSGAAMLLVDVDRHARLCEARGFGAGEAVLDDLLHHTAPSLRPSDLLTRLSDTQMAIFLAHADATGALDVAERIRERAEQREVLYAGGTAPGVRPGEAAVQRLRITVSIGVCQLRPSHLHLQGLLDDADDAVAAARQAGGNCVRAAPVDGGRLRLPGGVRGERRGAKPKPAGPSA